MNNPSSGQKMDTELSKEKLQSGFTSHHHKAIKGLKPQARSGAEREQALSSLGMHNMS